MYYAKNPILPGFCPDPSICRVGEDYYLVVSSFAYFPGVPVFHSKDLAHWEQIGNALERTSQLPLAGCGHSQGIYAPTIRYYDGTFYMITTNVSAGGNFIVTATNPAGPWSEPYFLGEDAQGIDPSLFFDDDGSCYYIGTRPNQKGVRYNGDWEIWIQKMDLSAMALVGSSHKVWKGAGHHVIWPEGPHLYKKDGYYYLMHAEGGTADNHAVAIARSRDIWGTYEGCPNNPILTHRHLGTEYPITAVGHGDLVADENDNWYMVMLGSRRCEGHVNTGRDTYLAKVTWENGWPVVNKGVGKLEELVELPGEAVYSMPEGRSWHFYRDDLPKCFMTLRGRKDVYRLMPSEGRLRLYAVEDCLTDCGTPAYVAVRQQDYEYRMAALMEFTQGTDKEEAGIAVLCDEKNHMRLVKCYENGEPEVLLMLCEKGEERVVARQKVSEGRLELNMVCHGQKSDWYVTQEDGDSIGLASGVDMRMLSTECTGGFTGCTLGMYASANGKKGENHADFFWFSCEGIQE